MAVPSMTGDGSSSNPYVPYDYNQLRTAFGNAGGAGGHVYIKLPNSTSEEGYVIDCKDYEWTTIGATDVELDLNGGCIKNINVSNGNQMFSTTWDGISHSSPINILSSKPKGRILNIFGKEATAVCGTGNFTLTNVSMSINASGFSDDLFPGGTYSKCSFYIEDSRETLRYIFGNSSKLYMCDTKICFYAASKTAIYKGGRYGVIQDCRFRGSAINNINHSATNTAFFFISATGSGYNTSSFYSNIIDIDNRYSDGSLTANYLLNTSVTASVYTTSVFNSDKMDSSKCTQLKAATSAQIKDNEWLNNNGFPVVKKASESGE